MYILGLQGSPRKKGNSSIMLSTFLSEAEKLGAHTQYIDVTGKNIVPCQECGTCEKKGYCPIDDDMQEIYPLFRRADIIIIATPVFFYGPTAQIKALIDRSQALWSRRYVFNLRDPGRKWRRGLLLSVGATKGKNLFEGINLTAKYFFDAVGAHFDGAVTYNQIEKAGEILKHPTAVDDVRKKAGEMVRTFAGRKKVLFLCTENACRSQMARAFTQQLAGDGIEAESAGSAPAQDINPIMEEVMNENGIDMAFCKPRSIDETVGDWKPDLIISMGCGEDCPVIPGTVSEEWDVEDPSGKPIDFMRQTKNIIEEKVKKLITVLK